MRVLMLAYRREAKLGRPHPDWFAWVGQYCDWLILQQRADGSFPRRWKPSSNEAAEPSGTASYNAVPVPVLMSEITGDDKYRKIAQGAMLLHFTHAYGGLLLKGSGRGAFEVAGADHIWFPAEAHLVNGVVVVSTSLVQQPTAVRYTWSSLAAAVLFDSAGLPASPFRTER